MLLPNHKRITVAVATHDTTICQSIRQKFPASLAEVICIPSLEQLLCSVGREAVDIVIIDSGISNDLNKTIVRALKKMNRHVKILVMSGNDSPQFEMEMRTSGVTYFGLKPVAAAVLEDVVGKIISNQDRNLMYN